MPDDVWPPKPNLADPLTEYDDVIAALLASPGTRITSKLLLIRALRDQEGLELRQAYALANSYCDRHGLFITGPVAKAMAWGGCGLVFANLCLAGFLCYLTLVRYNAVLSHPHHHAALRALNRQEMSVTAALVLMNVFVIVLARTQRIARKGR